MDALWRDLRFARRSLARTPALAAAAILTLALGIGVSTALFSVVDGVLFKPLPIRDSERVVGIVLTRLDRGGHYSVSYHNFIHWRDRNRTFAALAAARDRTVALTGEGAPERLEATEVSPSYFEVMGAEPVLGRSFLPGEGQGEGARVTVLSNELWRRRFAADPQILGRSLTLDGEAYQVVGVMQPGEENAYLEWRQLWTPLAVDEAEALARPLRGFSVVGRLADGVSLEAARQDLAAVARWVEEEAPTTNQGWGAEIHTLRWWIVGEVEAPLLLLLGAVALVLLIACVNVSSLLLSRAPGRQREVAVMAALGASRGRLLRQALMESSLLAAAGGLVGVGITFAGVRLFLALAPDYLPRLERIAVDGRVLAATAAATLLVALGSGLAPALRSSRGNAGDLGRGPGAGEARESRRLRGALVAVEVAVAVVVVAGSALLGRSLLSLSRVDPGFEPDGLLTLRFELPEASAPEEAERITLYRQLLERIEALPGVEGAGASGVALPLRSGQGVFQLYVEDQPRSQTPEVVVTAQMVSPGYFRAMGIRKVAGRLFADDETWDSSHAVIVNETLARRYWPGGDAVGKWVEWQSGDRGWIVGVIADVRQLELTRDPAAEAYIAWGKAQRSQALAVRTSGRPAALAGPVRHTIQTVIPGATVWDIQTGRSLVARSYADRTFSATLMALFAVLALTLGVVGVYGVVSHATSRRTREMGVRMALGARRGNILALVVRSGMVPVAVGLAAGVALALVGGRFLAGQLFGITPTDPASLALAALSLAAAGLTACALPALRAARIPPALSLRQD